MSALSTMQARAIGQLQPNRLLSALTAGLITGVLAIVLNISYAALIFSDELSPYLPTGIGLALFSGVVIGFIVALFSSYPAVVAKPQDTVAAITALMAASVAAHLKAQGAAQQILPTLVAIIALSSILTGIFFLLLGRFRLGSLIRFIPYPVVGGFLAGTGWLILTGAMTVMTGRPFSIVLIPSLFQPDLLSRWLPGALFAVVLLILVRRYKHYLITPGLLLGGLLLFYAILWLGNTSIAQASERGWLLGPFPERALWNPLALSELSAANWGLVAEQAASFAAILIVSAVSLLLNSTGIELATRTDIDLNRELEAAGIANVAAGLGGGLAGYHTVSLSVLSNTIGANSRLVGIVVAALCAAVLWLGGALLVFFPKPILGGVLFFLGMSFVVEWVFDAWLRLPRGDYGLVILILFVIGAVGFLQGVGLGLGVAVALFVINYSHVNVVKHALSGVNRQSNVDRPASQRRVLQAHGDQIYILKLQGYLFFGTANGLLDYVRNRVNDGTREPLRFVLFDFRLVHGMDSSAVLSFSKLRQLAQARNFTVILAQLAPDVMAKLKRAADADRSDESFRIMPSLDHGLEWCEDQIVAAERAAVAQPIPLVQQLADRLPSRDLAPRLMDYLEPIAEPAQSHLIRQGAPSDEMYLIESGRVTVLMEMEGCEPTRLRTMGAGTVVGELGFYLGTPRAASVVTDESSTLFRLTRSAMQRMSSERPEMAAALHEFVAHLLAERLVNTNKTVEALLE